MLGALLLHVLRGFRGSLKIEGIDFVEDGGGVGRQSELSSACCASARRQREKTNDAEAPRKGHEIHRD
jgi:hypothetical protein